MSVFCNAHTHVEYLEQMPFVQQSYRFCVTAGSRAEYERICRSVRADGCLDTDAELRNPAVRHFIVSAGIHPWSLIDPSFDSEDFFSFLERQLQNQAEPCAADENGAGAAPMPQIAAIGETGFDLFSPGFRAALPLQINWWNRQLALAAEYRLPLVIHNRKGMQYILKSASVLKQLPSVIFHGYTGSPEEAASILCKGINAYFSFGKTILDSKSRARATLRSLDADRILLETDMTGLSSASAGFSHAAQPACADIVLSELYQLVERECSIKDVVLLENFRAAFAVQI